MNRRAETGGVRVRTVVLSLVAIVVVLMAGLFLAARMAGDNLEEEVLARSRATLGPLDVDPTEGYPSRATNDDAVRMERLAGGLGVELTPKVESRQTLDPKVAGERVQAGAGDSVALKELMLATGPGLPEMPQKARAFCEKHAALMGGLARLAAEGDPRWVQQMELGLQAPLPHLLGYLRVQRLLLTCSWERELEGAREERDLYLEASWRLNERLAERPELISGLIDLAVLRFQAAVLRHLPDPDPVWTSRFAETKVRDRMQPRYLSDMRMFYQAFRDPSKLSGLLGHRGASSVVTTVTMPLLRRTGLRILLAQVEMHGLAAEAGPCGLDLVALRDEVRDLCDSINPITRAVCNVATPNVVGTWARVHRAAVELEMAARVLELRRVLGEAPAPPRSQEGLADLLARAGVSETGPCAGARWAYVYLEDGGPAVRLALEGAELSEADAGTSYPLTQTLSLDARP